MNWLMCRSSRVQRAASPINVKGAQAAGSAALSARLSSTANVAICSLPGFTLPGDVSGSDKAYRQDIVDPPIRAHSGTIEVPCVRFG